MADEELDIEVEARQEIARGDLFQNLALGGPTVHRIQQRAVDVEPFFVLVAVLFGSTLLGVIGALVAVPAAATVQIMIREWLRYREEMAIVRGIEPQPET